MMKGVQYFKNRCINRGEWSPVSEKKGLNATSHEILKVKNPKMPSKANTSI